MLCSSCQAYHTLDKMNIHMKKCNTCVRWEEDFEKTRVKTEIISFDDFNTGDNYNRFRKLMIEDQITDVLRHTDTRKLRKENNIPKGATIKHIFVYNDNSPLFVNRPNPYIEYKYEVCALDNQAGSFKINGINVSIRPAGNAVIVYK